jgi:hypothetical protein
MADNDKRFSVDVVGDYIHLKTWGALKDEDLDAPVNAAINLAKERGITKLIDDIRDIDTTNVSLTIQVKSMGIMWKLRTFKKVALVLKDSHIRSLLFSTLEALHLNIDARIKTFDDVAEAVNWLRESEK